METQDLERFSFKLGVVEGLDKETAKLKAQKLIKGLDPQVIEVAREWAYSGVMPLDRDFGGFTPAKIESILTESGKGRPSLVLESLNTLARYPEAAKEILKEVSTKPESPTQLQNCSNGLLGKFSEDDLRKMLRHQEPFWLHLNSPKDSELDRLASLLQFPYLEVNYLKDSEALRLMVYPSFIFLNLKYPAFKLIVGDNYLISLGQLSGEISKEFKNDPLINTHLVLERIAYELARELMGTQIQNAVMLGAQQTVLGSETSNQMGIMTECQTAFKTLYQASLQVRAVETEPKIKPPQILNLSTKPRISYALLPIAATLGYLINFL